MSKHTPGPWSYDGKFTVGIPHKDGDTYFRTNPEDARLISAAPELLECLKEACTDTGFGGATKWLEVIAKAEGKE